MSRLEPRHSGALTLLAICIAIVVSLGCSDAENEGFAIHLTQNNVPPSETGALSDIELAGEPLISTADVVSYDATTHEMKLTRETFERLVALEVPVSGTSFAVCVDGDPVYWGAFWTPISSLSFEGVIIMAPFSDEGEPVVRLERGYPSASFSEADDPRDSPEVLAALDQAGKLAGAP